MCAGQQLLLVRDRLPPRIATVFTDAGYPSPTYAVDVLCASGRDKRSWEVRLVGTQITTTLTNRVLDRAISESFPTLPSISSILEGAASSLALIPAQSVNALSDDDDDSLESITAVDNEEEKDVPIAIVANSTLLSPHGFLWTPVAENTLLSDLRNRATRKPYFKWNCIGLDQFGSAAIDLQAFALNVGSRSPLHYFMLSFPVNVVHGIISRTNARIANIGGRRRPDLTTQLFFKFIGLCYMMTLCEQPNRRDYWIPNSSSDFFSNSAPRFWPIHAVVLF